MLAVVLAFGSSLCWGTADFFGGLQSRRRSLVTVLLFAQGTAVVLAVAYAAAAGDAVPAASDMGWAAGAGLAGCAALAAFYRGLAIGTMSIVAPVSATGAAVPVLVGVAGGERPSLLQVAGITVAIVGIVLAAREPGAAVPSRAARASVGLALIAALGFGRSSWGSSAPPTRPAWRGRSSSPAARNSSRWRWWPPRCALRCRRARATRPLCW